MKRRIPIIALLSLILILPISSVSVDAAPNEKRVIIIYKNDISPADVQDLQKVAKMIKSQIKMIRALVAVVDESEVQKIAADENVAGVYDDIPVHSMLAESIPQIRADQVHASGVTGSGARVCIVDTGVDDSHPYLPPLVAESDFYNDDNDATDDNGHGTHVAGIVASSHSVYGGVADGASLMAAKVLSSTGSGFSSDVISGIEWCVNNEADVINMSLGGGAYTGTCDNEAISIASNQAVDSGVIVVAASGNDGFTNAMSAPACASKVIAVGAVTQNDGRTSFSNEGSELDVVAPGTSITSTYLNGNFATLTGTSMATPHAAALAALLLQANSSLTPSEARNIIRSSAVDLGASGFDTIYGYGRIDAFAAYEMATGQQGGDEPPPPSDTNTVFSDDFNNFSQWQKLNVLNWNVEPPAEIPVPGTSSNTVAHADNCDSGCILEMKDAIDLSSYSSAELKFWRFVDNGVDRREYLQVQLYDGSSWNMIYSWTHGQGDDNTWHEQSYDLSSYLVNNFKIRFVAKMSLTSEEVEVDKVVIEGTPSDSSNPDPQPNQAPEADAGGPYSSSEGATVTFDASLSSDPDGLITGYSWDFGDGSSGTGVNPTHVYADDGIYTVSLTVTDDQGASASASSTADIGNTAPLVNAGPDQTVFVGEQVFFEGAFDDAGSADTHSVLWDFGDSSTSDSLTTTHTYQQEGSYIATLTVTDDDGGIGTDSILVTVNENSEPGEPQTVFFDDFTNFSKWTESNEFDWNVERYAERNIPGYPSSNTVAHADACRSSTGCIITMTDAVNLSAYDSATLSFWRYLDASLDSGEYLRVQISAGSSWNTIYSWTNGNGDDDTWHQETYDIPSEYLTSNFNVRFIAKMSSSYEDAEVDDVEIVATSGSGGSATINEDPVANAGSNKVGDEDQTIELDATNSYDPDGTIVLYEWDLGNGDSASGSVLNYVYSDSGTYSVTLTVSDNDGASSTDSILVTIDNVPPVANAGSDQAGIVGQTLTFDGSASTDSPSDVDALIYEWTFGDGFSSTGKVASHAYSSVGDYTVTLTVTDDDGAFSSDSLTASISDGGDGGDGGTPVTETVFFDDFDDLSKWTESNEFDWNVESPAERAIPGTSSNTVAHADRCSSSTGCIITMTTPLDLTSYDSATISFWRYVDASIDFNEYLEVQIFDGSSWNMIYSWTNGNGDDDTWHQETYDIPSEYLTSNFNVRFIAKMSSSYEDAEIDDVKIEATTL